MTRERKRDSIEQLRAERLAALGRVPREVFALLSQSPTPLKAYELLWRLQAERGRPAPPSTIYRALTVLAEAGLVHRIESLGAFVVCTRMHEEHEPMFLICESCRRAFELNAKPSTLELGQAVAAASFRPTRFNFIVGGVCRECDRTPPRK